MAAAEPPAPSADIRSWLEPLLPKTWKWVEDERSLARIDVVTVVLTASHIEREASSPQSQQRVTWQLSVIQPGKDATETEADLFVNVHKVLIGIDDIDRKANPRARGFTWTGADKALWPKLDNLCWQIDLVSITAKTP